MNDFSIEPGTPDRRAIGTRSLEDLAEAIEETYPMETEDARLIWCGISTRLSYKYDVSVVIEDLIRMLEECAGTRTGRFDVNFGSNTFNADWKLELTSDTVVVNARWHSIPGHSEDRLNGCAQLLAERRYFREQWLKIVRRVVEDIDSAETRIEDASLLRKARGLCARGSRQFLTATERQRQRYI